EVVVGAPHRDRPGTGRSEMLGGGEAAALAADVGEDAVAAFLLQRLQGFGERLCVIHGMGTLRIFAIDGAFAGAARLAPLPGAILNEPRPGASFRALSHAHARSILI